MSKLLRVCLSKVLVVKKLSLLMVMHILVYEASVRGV